MRTTLPAVFLVLLAFVSPAAAGNGLVATGAEAAVPSLLPSGDPDLIEGWNDTEEPLGLLFYEASCYGLPYVPASDYLLARIDFIAGFFPGDNAVEVHADDGSGHPTGKLLGRATFSHGEEVGWYGGEFPEPISLQAGELYYLLYQPAYFSLASVALEGDLIAHTWSFDCVEWLGPAEPARWMARFYGFTEPTVINETTWSGIKALYQ